jgi:hypothetical protein
LPLDQPSSEASEQGPRETASQILHRLCIGAPEDKVTFAQILDALGKRGFGLLLIVMAIPNLLPVPGVPGVSSFTAIVIVYLAIQLMLAQNEPKLPAWISRKSFTRGQLARFIMKATPFLRWLERPTRPRWMPVVTGIGARLIGLAAFLLALTLALPIPMGNLPQAVALILLALALIERDGLMAVLGYLASIAAFAWLTAVILGLGKVAVVTFT